MRLLLAIFALPALAMAQQQIPLMDQVQGYFDKAQAYVKSAVPGSGRVGSAHVADQDVTRLTLGNWKSVLMQRGASKAQDAPEAWMVYVTGGNKTCHGGCGPIDRTWNVRLARKADHVALQLTLQASVALFRPDVSAPHLAVLDCEQEELLCGAWCADTGSIWYILVPKPVPNQSKGPTAITIHNLLPNSTSSDITKIHTQKQYLNTPQYNGRMHPFDGWVVEWGLQMPVAYTLWGLSKIPSWAFMIFVSLFSRSIM